MKTTKLWFDNILKIDFIYKRRCLNVFEVPKIDKINLSICSKLIIENPKTITLFIVAAKLITSHKPLVCKAKKSIALLKLRKGMLVGVKVTFRKSIAYNFLTLLNLLVLPNIKNLRFNKINNNGSLSIGIKDLLIFPQLNIYYDKFPKDMSCTININSVNRDVNSLKMLFTGLQLPCK